MVFGRKKLWRPVVLVLIERNLWPEGSTPKRKWAGRDESATILLACILALSSCRTLTGTCSWPCSHLVVCTMQSSLCFAAAVDAEYCTVMDEVRTLSIVAL